MQPFRGQDSAVHRLGLIRVWRGVARGLCLQVATCRGVPVPVARGVQLTSLPGDSFQVAGASRQLAGVEPQAAAAVGRFLAGPGLDAWAGVLQGEGERWLRCQCPALPSPELGPLPGTAISLFCAHTAESPSPRSLCHIQRDLFCLGAASCKVRRFPFVLRVPHSWSVILGQHGLLSPGTVLAGGCQPQHAQADSGVMPWW